MRRLRARLAAIAITALSLGGCATITQGQMLRGPAIFGGIRMDIAILADDKLGAGSKVQAVLDMLFMGSLASDVILLPFSIPNEIIELVTRDGIDVRPPLHWDDPPPKKAPYSAPPERRVEENPGATVMPEDAGL